MVYELHVDKAVTFFKSQAELHLYEPQQGISARYCLVQLFIRVLDKLLRYNLRKK